MTNNVEFFRLITGEDLVSEYETIDDHYRLFNPCKIVYMSTTKQSHISISLMQWIFNRICDEQTFDLPKSQVQVKSSVGENMIDHYYSSVDHFNQVELKTKMNYEEFDEDVSQEEKLDLLNEFMNSLGKQNKGKLH